MFKLLLYFNIVLFFIKLNESKYYKRGHLNDNTVNSDAPLPNLWFPYPPNFEDQVKLQIINVTAAPEINVQNLSSQNNSASFYGTPSYKSKAETEISTTIATKANGTGLAGDNKTLEWPRLWIPFPPNYENDQTYKQSTFVCDNGKENISVDFDPENKRHSFNYLCFGNRREYEPNLNTSALLKKYTIPVAYDPPLKCLSEDIKYTESIPTYGAFRPVGPEFGSYIYLPPQRWLHSLAEGAIVMLYHPCAFAGQIERLQNTLRGCLYRHIVTPSQQLSPQRPLALMAWGKSLEMSVVDNNIVINFIKENAKMSFKQNQQKLKVLKRSYNAGLLKEAHLVTDEQDIEICGYQEMR